ncbi:hypothetical protein NXS19_011683 [Fusarium pseudograminearum]|nr:hypothetical protein NXS19_011683 [Fusarium pseudograminearum]
MECWLGLEPYNGWTGARIPFAQIPETMNSSASLCGLEIDGVLQVNFEIVASISWTDIPQDSPFEGVRDVLPSGQISSTEVDTHNCPFDKDVLGDLQHLA